MTTQYESMVYTEQAFQQFIEWIYGAAEDPGQWRNLYERLRLQVDAASIHMLGLDQRHGALAYSDGAELALEGELAYMQHYRNIDPRWPLLLAAGTGEWVHCHEVLDDDFVAQSEFFQDFLIPHDRRYMTAVKLADTPEVVVVMALLRTPAQGPMPADAVAFLDRLLPHLQRAVRIGLSNFFYSSQALAGQLMVDKLRQPVMLMTPGGEVIHANTAAHELMKATPLASVQEGRLALPAEALDSLLRETREMENRVKARALPDSATRNPGAMPFRSLKLGGDSTSLYAFYTMLAPHDVMGAFGLRPVVMLMFYHPASSPAIDPGLLFAAFGLTPVECRIASMLAEGQTLKQIAQAQGTQHETVRKQLQSIYQKTSTNRQPDLVRLLLHLPHSAG